MKHLGKLSFAMLAMVMAACSNNEEPVTPVTSYEGTGTNDVYASLKLRLPEGSRANDGEEVGQDFENTVGKILVVLATKDADGNYKYLTRAVSDSKPVVNGSGNTLTYVLNFSSKDMKPGDPLDLDDTGFNNNYKQDDVYVFAYCNPSEYLLTQAGTWTKGADFINLVAQIEHKDNAAMWTPNTFLMTNCEEAKSPNGIPARADLVRDHGTPEKALQLGIVYVKRAAARFDFKTTKIDGESEPNVYPINDIDGKTLVGKVKLTQMAMFNIAKEFYYIPRSNENWAWTGKTTVCGDLEGYVESPNAEMKKKNNLVMDQIREKYFSYLVGNPMEGSNGVNDVDVTKYDWVSITDWDANHDEDYDEGWGPDKKGIANYHIWRYTTENTIPQGNAGDGIYSQKVGITTGVVFKGEFDPVNTNRWNGNAVYVHDNIVYGDFKALKEYVESHPNTAVATSFSNVTAFKNVAEDADIKSSLLSNVNKADRSGFKAYETDETGKYVMYYFYYNRHNTNGNNSLMRENEFGVVRNNVYKLSVTKVESFGEPESPNDPDDPNEEEHAYFTVNCEVLPWTVRINDIEF